MFGRPHCGDTFDTREVTHVAIQTKLKLLTLGFWNDFSDNLPPCKKKKKSIFLSLAITDTCCGYGHRNIQG